MTTSAAFRKIQLGEESTVHGTAVAADRIIYGELTVTPEPTQYEPANESRFSLAGRHTRDIISQLTTLSYEGVADFQSLHTLFTNALVGGVSGTGANEDKTWLFTWKTLAANAPKTFTWEYGSNIQAFEVANVFPTELSIAFTMEEAVGISMAMSGSILTPTTITSLSYANFARELVKASHLKVYINDSQATIGDTEFAGKVVGCTLTIPTGLEMARYAKGSLNPSAYVEAVRIPTLEMTFAFDSNADAEVDDFQANTDRFIRLFVDSGVEIASTGTLVEILSP
jgi:hypothetical protein